MHQHCSPVPRIESYSACQLSASFEDSPSVVVSMGGSTLKYNRCRFGSGISDGIGRSGGVQCARMCVNEGCLQQAADTATSSPLVSLV